MADLNGSKSQNNRSPGTILPAGGEMKRLTYAKDWSRSPLGPISNWPQSLKSAVEIMLNSRYPMLVWWGPELIQLYNDAYTPVLGLRHPSGLGQPAAECWAEAWPTVGPLAEAVMTQGVSTWSERLQIVMTRNGWPEEVYMTFSYSPVTDESGGIGGLFCACTEETQRVFGERRLRSLRALSEEAGQAKTVKEASRIAVEVLGRDRLDVPFALIYLNGQEGNPAKLAASQGLSPNSPAAVPAVDLRDEESSGWPLYEVTRTGLAVESDLMAAGFEPVTNDVWPEPVTRALVLPLARPGQDALAGFVIAGISPRLNLDEGYRTFLDLMARQVATVIASARVYEEERRRVEVLAELDRAKTAFFSNVSQEFRTQLTLILGPLEEEIRAQPNGSPNLEIAYRNAVRLLKLVNTLLDLARIEAGGIDVEGLQQGADDYLVKPFSARELLARVQAQVAKARADRKRADEALRESEVQFRALFSALDEAVMIVERLPLRPDGLRDWRYVGMNPAAQSMFHVGDLTGQTVRENFPDEDEGWYDIYDRALETGEVARFEREAKSHGMVLQMFVARLGSRPSGRIMVVMQDVTAQRRAEAALRENQERQAFLLKLSDSLRAEPDAHAVADRAIRMLIEQMQLDRGYIVSYRIGDDRAHLVHQVGNETVPPLPDVFILSDYPAAFRAIFDQTLVIEDEFERQGLSDAERHESGKLGMRAMVAATVRKGDYPLWSLVAISSRPRRWTRAEIALVEETAERTWAAAERARAEAALRESEEKFRRVFDSIDEGFCILELVRGNDGQVESLIFRQVNKAFTRQTGLSDVVGKTIRETLPDCEQRWIDIYANVAETGESRRVEDYAQSVGRWYNVHFTALSGPGSNLVATVFDDVTERKRTEQALRAGEERQAFLLALGDAMRVQTSANGVIEAAARLLGQRLGASRVLFAEFDEARGIADVFHAWFADGADPFPAVMQLNDYDGPILNDLRAGRTVRIANAGDPSLARPGLPAIAEFGVKALLSVPLLVSRRLVVNLSVHQHAVRWWTDEEVALVEEVAERLWADLVRARAEAALRESQETLAADLQNAELLRSLAERLVTEESFETIYDEVMYTTIAVARGDAGTVQIYDPDTKSLVLLTSKNFPLKMTNYFHRVDASSRTACGIALRTGQRAFVDFSDQDGDFGCMLHVQAGIHAALALPLLSRMGTPLGMLNVHWREARHRPTPKQLRFLDLIARQAADLIEQRKAQTVLRQSEEQFRRALEEAPIPVIMHAEDGQVLQISRTWTELTGFQPEDIPTFEAWLNHAYGEGADAVRRHMRDLFQGNRRTINVEFPIRTRTGETRFWSFSASSPGSLRDGRRFIVGMAIDVTGRRRAEETLRQSEQRFRLLVDNVLEYALFQTDLEGKATSWNPGAERLFGYTGAEMLGRKVDVLLTPEDREQAVLTHEIQRVQTGELQRDSRWMVRKDGTRFWAQWVTEPAHDDAGALRGVVKVLRDETERKRAEERQLLMMGELNHRVKNTLATVQSIASQTLRGSPDPEQFVVNFQARLHALSRAHNLLTRRSWEAADITDVVRDQLTMGADEDRITIAGPPALLSPQSAVALALVLHELGTNARKYGALSSPAGHVRVGWTTAPHEPLIVLNWTEIGGPAVRPPAERGFGTAMIEKSLGGVGGSTELSFHPEGLRCIIRLPVAASGHTAFNTSE